MKGGPLSYLTIKSPPYLNDRHVKYSLFQAFQAILRFSRIFQAISTYISLFSPINFYLLWLCVSEAVH